MSKTAYTVLWLVWLAMFIAIEGQAFLYRVQGGTLSEHVWAWFSIKGKGAWWRARRFVLLAFLAWLTVHFLTGGAF